MSEVADAIRDATKVLELCEKVGTGGRFAPNMIRALLDSHAALLALVCEERDELNAYMLSLGSANVPGFKSAHKRYSKLCAAIAKIEGPPLPGD